MGIPQGNASKAQQLDFSRADRSDRSEMEG